MGQVLFTTGKKTVPVSATDSHFDGHENGRVFSRTRSIDLYFVSYGEFGELIMKLVHVALGLWLLAAHARGALPEKS